MNDTKYNGWTNYSTWRVNLEIFDGNSLDTWLGYHNACDLGKALQEYVEGLIYDSGGANGTLAVDYALAFLSDVNWHEIAEHIMADLAEDAQV